MALSFRLRASIQGVTRPTIGGMHPKLPSLNCHSWSRFKKHNCTTVTSGKIQVSRNTHLDGLQKYALSASRNHHLATTDDDFDPVPEPFWFYMFKETIRALKFLLIFLVEQPGQLKYIEWPSFQSTLKTATLTLLLVGMLIIALSSVDSALCYILSLLSTRRA